MPWSMDDLPSVAKKWTKKQQRRCIAAGNAALEDGKSEEQAIFACIGAAGKTSDFLEEQEEEVIDEIMEYLGLEKAKWSTAFINDLPDSAFLYIEPGGEKDDEGKTKPRSLRHFPYKDKDGTVDLPHLRNAIARIPQSSLDEGLKKKLQKRAQNMLEHMKEEKATKSEMSFEAVSKQIYDILKPKYDPVTGNYVGDWPWIIATYSDRVVCMVNGQLLIYPYTIEDDTVTLGEAKEIDFSEVDLKSGFKVKKDADGVSRWLSISSNTFRDKHGEEFAKKALDFAVDFFSKTGKYGELRVEHHPASRIGVCMSSKMVGPLLLETGTFDDTPRAVKAIKSLEEDTENNIRVSIGFFYNKDYYDKKEKRFEDKVVIAERSLTKSPANEVTGVTIFDEIEEFLKGGKEVDMKSRLAAILGEDEAKAIMEAGDEKLKALYESLGVKFHEEEKKAETPRMEETQVKAAMASIKDATVAEALLTVLKSAGIVEESVKASDYSKADGDSEDDKKKKKPVDDEGKSITPQSEIEKIVDAKLEPITAQLKTIAEHLESSLPGFPRDVYRASQGKKDDNPEPKGGNGEPDPAFWDSLVAKK